MKRRYTFITILFICTLMTIALPQLAGAYSYGNPNEEAVAENYKQVAAKLNENPSNYAGAAQALAPIQQELDMHMGPEPFKAIKQALTDEDKQAALMAYQQTLVLNVARRMESIEKDFANYENNKMMIAKARATYEALSPIVQQKDAAVDLTVRADFDAALAALGNPGLFGVGVKQPEQAVYTSKKEAIFAVLQKQFNMDSIEVGHFKPGEGPGNSEKKESTGITDPKNWIPFVVIVLVLGFIIFRTMRKRRA